jgi:hypothetical protein
MRKNSKGMSGHQSAKMKTDTYLTPPWLLENLGEFDLDPCTPEVMPWETAKHRYTKVQDGLISPWFGRVWCNPPYGSEVEKWLLKLSEHGNGISLIFARTETEAFFNGVWDTADSILFIKGRLYFYDIHGVKAKANAGGPSALIAYGENNVQALADSKIPGKHLLVNTIPMIVVGVSPTWRMVVKMALTRCGDKGAVDRVYEMVEVMAPEKTIKNRFWKEKVRQQLQYHFTRIEKGIYAAA